MDKPKDTQEYILVVCPLCATRMHVRPEHVGKRIRCPDCDTVTRIEPAKTIETPKVERPNPGEYGVRIAPGKVEDKKEWFGFHCGVCGTLLHATPDQVGQEARCPDCHKTTVVPSPPPKPPKAALREVGEYSVGEEKPRAMLEFYKPPKRTKKESQPVLLPPPHGWLVKGLIDFPFRGQPFAHWVMMVILLVLAGEGVAGLLFLVRVLSSLGLIPTMIFGLGATWLWIWALSYSAACFEGAVQDTANGVEEYDSWTPPDWRENVWIMARVTFVFMLSGVVAYGIFFFVRNIVPAPLIFLSGTLIQAFVFPVLLLSMYESDNLMFPYSPVILNSLAPAWAGWLGLYLLSIAMFFAVVFVTVCGALVNMFVAPLFMAPALATFILMYGRLIGRVGWRVGRLSQEKPRRKESRESVGAAG